MNYVIIFLIAIAVIFGGFLLFQAGEKADLQECKDKYGSSYTLGHSNANSSIRWCVGSDGTMKDL